MHLNAIGIARRRIRTKKEQQFVDWSVKLFRNDIAMEGVHCGIASSAAASSGEIGMYVIWPERVGFSPQSFDKFALSLIQRTFV